MPVPASYHASPDQSIVSFATPSWPIGKKLIHFVLLLPPKNEVVYLFNSCGFSHNDTVYLLLEINPSGKRIPDVPSNTAACPTFPSANVLVPPVLSIRLPVTEPSVTFPVLSFKLSSNA